MNDDDEDYLFIEEEQERYCYVIFTYIFTYIFTLF